MQIGKLKLSACAATPTSADAAITGARTLQNSRVARRQVPMSFMKPSCPSQEVISAHSEAFHSPFSGMVLAAPRFLDPMDRTGRERQAPRSLTPRAAILKLRRLRRSQPQPRQHLRQHILHANREAELHLFADLLREIAKIFLIAPRQHHALQSRAP